MARAKAAKGGVKIKFGLGMATKSFTRTEAKTTVAELFAGLADNCDEPLMKKLR